MSIYMILFVLGSIFGSFFNVAGLRVPLKKSIVAPRSACPHCRHSLSAGELVPIFSYLVQGGKCRRCRARISPLYPAVELATGLLFAASFFFTGWTVEFIIALTLVSLLMTIFVSDIAYMMIPDKILLFFAGIFLLERLLFPLYPWWDSLLGTLIGFALLLFIALASKGGMGGGDIKLFALIGFVLGVKSVLLSFFLSTFYGAIFGIIGLLLGLVKRKNPIPFGPFIVAGTLTAYFLGDRIIQFYLRLMAGG